MRGKRKTTPWSPLSVVAHLDDLMIGSNNMKVDPDACVPFAKIRRTIASGVLGIMALYDGQLDVTGVYDGSGIAPRPDMQIFV